MHTHVEPGVLPQHLGRLVEPRARHLHLDAPRDPLLEALDAGQIGRMARPDVVRPHDELDRSARRARLRQTPPRDPQDHGQRHQ